MQEIKPDENGQRRGLAFYKESGLPWTQDELEKVTVYCEDDADGVGSLGEEESKLKYIYDDGDDAGFQHTWSAQYDEDIDSCTKISYEEMFEGKVRIPLKTFKVKDYGEA